MTLRPYQIEGAAFLASRKAALLADEPRLGKTVQAIRACDLARVLKVLVVCPAGVVENWRREIAARREGDWTAYVTSFDKAAGSDRARLLADEFDVAIIDEAHYLKNLSAKRTTALYGKAATMVDAIAARAAQVWLLTGTPMPNHAGELYPHLRALHPDAIRSTRTGLPWTFHQFASAYCTMRHTGFGQVIGGSKNEDRLHEKLAGFMLRRRKRDVLSQIPPTSFVDLYLEGRIEGVDFAEMEAVRAALREHGAAGLRKVSQQAATLRRLTGMAKVAPMREWLDEWLENNPPSDKIVVFAHHHDVIEGIYDKVHRAFVRVNKYTKAKERQVAIDRFRDDDSVRGIVCRVSAEGVGISLARSSEMVVVEAAWTPGVNDQVFERIVDIGKTDPCTVRLAMLAGTIDEDIQRAVTRKARSIAAVVDGV